MTVDPPSKYANAKLVEKDCRNFYMAIDILRYSVYDLGLVDTVLSREATRILKEDGINYVNEIPIIDKKKLTVGMYTFWKQSYADTTYGVSSFMFFDVFFVF